MKMKYMAVFGHLSALLVAFVILRGSAAGVFASLMDFLGGFLTGPEGGASSTFFTLPASLFLLLLFVVLVVLICQLPALIVTKLIMDRDQ